MSPLLGQLAALFAELSLVAIGGVNTVLPEMQRQVVDVHGWLGRGEFAALFALAQAAPGPNMLVSTLIGWRVAGVPGALVATASLIGPSSVLTWATSSAWHRFREKPWRKVIQAGLTPVTVGLVMAAAGLLAASTATTVLGGAITLLGTVALLATRTHPLWVLAAGATLGVVLG